MTENKIKTEIEIKTIKLSELHPTKNNPRKITKEDLEQLQKNVRDFPEMLDVREIVVDENMRILGGHQRVKALKANGETEATVKIIKNWTEKQKERFVIQDNVQNGEWDEEILLDWDQDLLKEIGQQVPEIQPYKMDDDSKIGAVSRRFGAPPLSVLDTRQGYWREGRRKWDSLGIESELGREEDLLGGYKDLAKRLGIKHYNGTSVFDPFLCELMYSWFSPDEGRVLDPFAGGSVRGVVASKLGHDYTGIDLRAEQVKENIRQGEKICKEEKHKPTWLAGDSNKVLDTIDDGQFDMIMSCPPYADLEVYSNDAADLSNMEYDQFLEVYRSIIKKAVKKLKENRFACFVVSEIRSHDKNGKYRDFVGDTIRAFEDAGMDYYNELVLINPFGPVAMRVTRQFNSTRKIGRVHQNVLVFYKGAYEKIKETHPEFKGTEWAQEFVDQFNEDRKIGQEYEKILVFYKGSIEDLRKDFAEYKDEIWEDKFPERNQIND